MASVSCGCDNTNCQASPHRGRDHCSSTADPPSYGGGETWGGGTSFGVPEGWRPIEGDNPGAMCPDCAKGMQIALDESGGLDTGGGLS